MKPTRALKDISFIDVVLVFIVIGTIILIANYNIETDSTLGIPWICQ